MKKKAIQLNIPTPCHEDWSAMTPNEKGKFCDSCAKPVIDFSGMSDVRLTAFLNENKGQKMCGRFTESQLNRTLINPMPEHKSNHLRAVLLGATLTTVFGLESCKNNHEVLGELGITETTVTHQSSILQPEKTESNERQVVKKSDKHTTELSGVVRDEYSGEGISHAEIVVFSDKGVQIALVKTKKNGSFKLNVNLDLNPTFINIYTNDYMDKIVMLGDVPDKQNIIVPLSSGVRMLKGEVMIIEE